MPNVTFSGSLPFSSLYSATVFKLTCAVELGPHVNTPVTVLTMWRKNNEVLRNSTRISVDSEATQNSSVMTVYESSVVFDPLSNTRTETDSGSYKCSAKIMDSEFVSGVSLNATKTLKVKGQCKVSLWFLSGLLIIMQVLENIVSFHFFSRSSCPSGDGGGCWQVNCWRELFSGVFSRDSRWSEA